jgi:hypothetical protein
MVILLVVLLFDFLRFRYLRIIQNGSGLFPEQFCKKLQKLSKFLDFFFFTMVVLNFLNMRIEFVLFWGGNGKIWALYLYKIYFSWFWKV